VFAAFIFFPQSLSSLRRPSLDNNSVEQSHTAITAAGRTGTLPCDDQWLRYSYSDKPGIGIKEGEVRGAKYGKRNAFVYYQPLGHFYDLWRIFSYTCLLALTGAREELSSAPGGLASLSNRDGIVHGNADVSIIQAVPATQ
jgi:hypothetical protein